MATEDREITCVILTDLSKTIETVNHDILSSKLEYYRRSGHVHSLLRSYLGGKYQAVKQNELSNMKLINFGIP